MSSTEQAIFTLKIVLTVAPVAAYFLMLGVVNSQATPRLVSARRDFLVLTGAFLPAFLWPVPVLLTSLGWQALLGVLTIAVLLLRARLPHPWKHWVIYNADAPLAANAVERTLKNLAWPFRREANHTFILPQLSMKIEVGGLGLLNTANLSIRQQRETFDEIQTARLIKALDESLQRYRLLPSVAGLCLVLAGSGLMIVPLWMMTRHMRDIVEAIGHLFLA